MVTEWEKYSVYRVSGVLEMVLENLMESKLFHSRPYQ